MSSRSAYSWEKMPSLRDGHYVSGPVYYDEEIFNDEREHIFKKIWHFVCHESEVAEIFDFRTTERADIPLIVTRGEDGRIRTFINVCSHRGARVVMSSSGNARMHTCFYHHWTYDTQGSCVAMPRPAGYAGSGVCKENMGLREVKTELKWGFVFVNFDDDSPKLDDYLDGALGIFEEVLPKAELEVFHYHRAEIDANWKAYQETIVDLYHEYMHVILRDTQMSAASMDDREMRTYANGHVTIAGLKADYEKYEGWTDRNNASCFPGLDPDDARFAPLFPAQTFITRGTVMRVDTVQPITAHKCLIESRGLGIKGESEEDRIMRIDHHNEYWGPFGRNVTEDAFAAEGCEFSFGKGAALRGIIARDEGGKGQCDSGLRGFWTKWSRRMGRPFSHPTND